MGKTANLRNIILIVLAGTTLLLIGSAQAENEPPQATIDSIAPDPAWDTQNVTFRGHGNDSDGTVAALAWHSSRDGNLSQVPEFTLRGLSAGNHTVSFRVQDDNGTWSANATASLTVFHNGLPLAALNLSTTELYREQDLTLFINGSDDRTAEQNLTLRLEYSLAGWSNAYLANLTWSGDYWQATFRPPLSATPGEYTFRTRFNDSMEGVGNWTYGSVEVLNHRPLATIESVSATGLNPGQPLLLAGSGSDADGTVTGYRWRSSRDGVLGDNASLTVTNLSSGSHTLFFAVRDNDGAWSAEVGARVAVNHPPLAVIELVTPSPAYDTGAVHFRGNGSDADGAVVEWLWYSSLDGNLSAIPEFRLGGLTPGNHTLTFRVRDDNHTWSVASASLLVAHNQLPLPLTLDAGGSELLRGRNLSLAFSGSDDNTSAASLLPEVQYLLPGFRFQDRELPNTYTTPSVMSADGECYAITTGDGIGEIQFFSTASATPLWSYDPGVRNLLVEQISGDGQYLLVRHTYNYDPNWLLLFTRDWPEPLLNFSVEGIIAHVAMSGDGEYFAVATWYPPADAYNYTIYMFHRQSTTPLWKHELEKVWNHSSVQSLAISDDGSYVAVGSTGRLLLFSQGSATPLWTALTSSHSVNSIAISGDGSLIAARNNDGKMYLFQKESNESVWIHTLGESNNVGSVSVSREGDHIVRGTHLGYVQLFSSASNLPLWSYYAGSEEIWPTAISAHGDYIAAGSTSGRIYYFLRGSSSPARVMETEYMVPNYFTLAADGQSLLTATNLFQRWSDSHLAAPVFSDGGWRATFAPPASAALGDYSFRVRFRDAHGGVGEWLYGNWTVNVQNNLPEAFIDAVAPSPGYDTQFFSFAGHGTDYEGGISGYEWRSDLDGVLGQSAAFERDGLSAGNHTISFRVRDTNAAWGAYATLELTVFPNQPPLVEGFNASRLEIFRGQNLTLHIRGSDSHDPETDLTLELQHTLPRHNWPAWEFTGGGEMERVALSSDGRWMAVAAQNGRLYFVDRENGFIQWTRLFESGVNATALALSPDGQRIAVGTDDRQLLFFGSGSPTPLWSRTLEGKPTALALTDDLLAVGDRGRQLSLFETTSGNLLWINETWGFVTTVALAGDYIAAGSYGPQVYLFHRDSAIPLWTVGTADQVLAVDLSADGSRLTAADGEGNLLLFARNSTLLWSRELGSTISALALSGDGETLVTGDAGGTLRCFAAGSGEPRWNRTAAGPVRAVALAHDGSLVAAAIGAGENATLLLAGDTGRLLWSDSADGEVLAVALSEDGEFVASGSADRTVRFYRHWRALYLGPPAHNATGWHALFAPSGSGPHGNYTLRLRLHDTTSGVSDWRYLAVEVLNNPPLALLESAPASPAIAGEPLNLTGSGSDPDGTIASYRWRSDRDGLLGSNSTLTLANLTPGAHSLFFAVRDSDGAWSQELNATLFINIRPQATISTSSMNLTHSNSLTLLWGYGSDADGNVTGSSWESDLDGVLGSGSDLRLYNLTPGNHNITFRVRDDLGAWSHPAYWDLRVNLRPAALYANLSSLVVLEGEKLEVTGFGNDSDGHVVAHAWYIDHPGSGGWPVASKEINANIDQSFQLTVPSPGYSKLYLFFAVIDNEGGWSDPLVTEFRINAPPVAVIDNITLTWNSNGTPVVAFSGHGEDRDNITALEWRSDLDGALGNVSSLALSNLTFGAHAFSLRVQDEWGAWSEWTEWGSPVAVAAAAPGRAPLPYPGWLLPVFLALLLAGAGRHYYAQFDFHRVRPLADRLGSLSRECELAGLDYPRQRFRKLAAGLTVWSYRRLEGEAAALERETLERLNRLVAAQRPLEQARALAARAEAAGIEYDRAQLAAAEEALAAEQWEEAKWAAAVFAERLRELLEDAN